MFKDTERARKDCTELIAASKEAEKVTLEEVPEGLLKLSVELGNDVSREDAAEATRLLFFTMSAEDFRGVSCERVDVS